MRCWLIDLGSAVKPRTEYEKDLGNRGGLGVRPTKNPLSGRKVGSRWDGVDPLSGYSTFSGAILGAETHLRACPRNQGPCAQGPTTFRFTEGGLMGL